MDIISFGNLESEKKMKVLQFISDLNGTTTTFIRKQIELLAKENYVAVLTNVPVKEQYRIPFVDYFCIPLPFLHQKLIIRKAYWLLYKFNIWVNFRQVDFANRANHLIKKIKPDVIHCQFGINGLILWENLLEKYKDIPFFIQFRGYDVTQMPITFPLYWKKLQAILKFKNVHTLAVANYLYDHMVGLGFKEANRRVLYSCTDLSFFERAQRESKKTTFLQVSSFREKKGHECTLNAFAEFLKKAEKSSMYKLILAGDGELQESSKTLSKKLKIDHQVEFIGKVTQAQGKQLMEEADFFVHHSITSKSGDKEGIPNAIMEAMAMELPILSTFHSGIPELVENGENGYLVQERDVDDYSDKMLQITTWEYQPQNREKVKNLFEQQKHLNTLISYYNEVI